VEDRAKSWVLSLWLSVAMVLALAVRIALVWSELPESMASHFGAGGRPDSFMSKGGFFVAMALIGGGSVAAVFAAPLLLRITPPKHLNLPNREYWLASDERRNSAFDRLAGLMGWVGAATTALLVIATELTIQANLERRNLDERTFLFFLAVYFVFIIAWLAQTMRIFRIPDASAP
jgi:uncharacterized membrane protein